MLARAIRIQPSQDPIFLAPNPSLYAAASNAVPSGDEPFIICVYTLKHKYYAMASQNPLAQNNLIAQAPHAANANQGSHSTHIQSMYPNILARKTSTPPFKVVPPTIPLYTSTERESKITSFFSLGHVATLWQICGAKRLLHLYQL
jgi:hypothetical protein